MHKEVLNIRVREKAITGATPSGCSGGDHLAQALLYRRVSEGAEVPHPQK